MTTEKRWKKLHEVKQKSFVGVKTLTKRKQQKKIAHTKFDYPTKRIEWDEGKKCWLIKNGITKNKNGE